MGFPAGIYWYKNHRARGSVPTWVQEFLDKPSQVNLRHDQPEEDPIVPNFNDVVEDGILADNDNSHEPVDQCEIGFEEPVQK